MKKTYRIVAALAVITALTVLLSAFAAAAGPAKIEFRDQDKREFVFGPGSEYTDTDLFPEFKGVMPGDVLRQEIRFTNSCRSGESVRLYMRAVPHNETDNPISMKQGENLKEHQGLEKMNEFLSQMSLRVYNGDRLISEAPADQTGGLTENVLLGRFRRGDTADLTVELEVPIEMGNEFAHRAGEVDWVFTVEISEGGGGSDPSSDPDPDKPGPGEKLPQTGQLKWPVPVLFVMGGILILLGMAVILRGKQERRHV